MYAERYLSYGERDKTGWPVGFDEDSKEWCRDKVRRFIMRAGPAGIGRINGWLFDRHVHQDMPEIMQKAALYDWQYSVTHRALLDVAEPVWRPERGIGNIPRWMPLSDQAWLETRVAVVLIEHGILTDGWLHFLVILRWVFTEDVDRIPDAIADLHITDQVSIVKTALNTLRMEGKAEEQDCDAFGNNGNNMWRHVPHGDD